MESRDAKLASGLKLAEQMLQLQDVRVRGMMIRANEDGDLTAGRALDQSGADARPHPGQPLGVSG